MERIKLVDEMLMVRYEADDRIVEANSDEIVVKDVVLGLKRDGKQIGSIYNDDGTDDTFVRLKTPGEHDFISFQVPKTFVQELLDTALTHDLVTEQASVEGYRTRMGLDTEQ